MVSVMGEPVVIGLEKGFALVKTLVTEGPMAAWEQLKEMAAEMRDAFIEAVKDFIKMKIIEQAIIWLVSLFIPGAGLLKAALGIYDTIVFFIQKAKQIATMVANFLGSIAEIAAGNIGAAADAMERGLARGLTLVISFLAKLLRLDAITSKIKAAIEKVRSKVDAVLLKVVTWIWDKAKKLFGALKKGVASVLQWWKKKLPFSGAGESHTLLFEGEKDSARLMVRSKLTTPDEFVKDFVPSNVPTKEAKRVSDLSKEIDGLKKKVATAQAKSPPNEGEIATLDQQLTGKFNDLGQVLATLLDKSADEGTDKNPVPVDYPKRRAAAYPAIYVGPVTDYFLKQDWLKTAAGAGTVQKAKDTLAGEEAKLTAEAGFKSWNGKVQIYRAADGPSQKLPDGNVVGLAPAFASLAPGKVLVYDDKGATGGGGKINKLFKPYGFRAGKEGLDGDHVMERQIGGPDAIVNLWPLGKSENRSSGSTVKSMSVTFGGKPMTVHTARQKRKKKNMLSLLVKKVVG
jgi:hypothetical protein